VHLQDATLELLHEGDRIKNTAHPLAWTNCVGKGRMFYSAIGHMPETYSQPHNVALLETAIDWAANSRTACKAKGLAERATGAWDGMMHRRPSSMLNGWQDRPDSVGPIW
jgi:type 1 glutamine amidotransferase